MMDPGQNKAHDLAGVGFEVTHCDTNLGAHDNTNAIPWKEHRQFITWRGVPKAGKPGKVDKLPTSPHTGEVINAFDSKHWVTYSEAKAAGRPVAFVLTSNDPYFCLDIDGCLQANNTWSPLAHEIVNAFPGAMVEVSQSGRGLHIWGRYTGPEPLHACKNVAAGIELYTSGRFIALGLQS
jgi:primase-polymerase (primpol)-like protein